MRLEAGGLVRKRESDETRGNAAVLAALQSWPGVRPTTDHSILTAQSLCNSQMQGGGSQRTPAFAEEMGLRRDRAGYAKRSVPDGFQFLAADGYWPGRLSFGRLYLPFLRKSLRQHVAPKFPGSRAGCLPRNGVSPNPAPNHQCRSIGRVNLR